MNAGRPGGLPERRAGVERRRRDGLGVLPPARTPQERQRRARLNRTLGVTMMVFGAFVTGGSVALTAAHPDLAHLIVLGCGASLTVQGVLLAGRRERRRQ